MPAAAILDAAPRAAAAPPPAIEIRGLSRAFGRRDARVEAVRGFDLSVAPGEFVSILGPSGCGKSTVLNMVAGLLPPTAGEILLHGRPVAGISPEVGYVTQQDNLLPWRTLLENVEVALELKVRQAPPAERRLRARAMLARVGLSGFEDRWPHELSGGMRQRANICRTLVYRPDVILMDEPFGPLDAMTRGVLQRELLGLWSEFRSTVLFVTHDIQEAILLSDRVVVMSARPGRIKAVERIAIPRPRDPLSIETLPDYAAAKQRLSRLIWDELLPGAGP
jgi:NitT/TauT family transport system ATP-binding protein